MRKKEKDKKSDGQREKGIKPQQQRTEILRTLTDEASRHELFFKKQSVQGHVAINKKIYLLRNAPRAILHLEAGSMRKIRPVGTAGV